MASEYLKWKYRDIPHNAPMVLTRKQKIATWWYYNKWTLVVIVGVIAVAIYLILRGLGFGIEKPDYQIAYVGENPLPKDTVSSLETALSSLGTDCNKDGQVVVRINQYVINTENDNEAMAAYAGGTKLMADIDDCDSYFFILDNGESFQKKYSILRHLDGSLPIDNGEDFENCCYPWKNCPLLKDLSLGSYTETILGEKVKGDSQELLGNLFIARRGFWNDKASAYVSECDSLWDKITNGGHQ